MMITCIYHNFSVPYAFLMSSRTWNLNEIACMTQEMYELQGVMKHCLSNTCSPASLVNDTISFANNALLPATCWSSVWVQFFLANKHLTFLLCLYRTSSEFWKMPDDNSRKLNAIFRIQLSMALTPSSNWVSNSWVVHWKGKFPRRGEGISQQTLGRLVTRKGIISAFCTSIF